MPSRSRPRSLMSLTRRLERHTSESNVSQKSPDPCPTFVNVNLLQLNQAQWKYLHIKQFQNPRLIQRQIPLSINPRTKDTVYLQNNDIRTIHRSSLLQPTVLHKTILGNLNFPSLLQLTQLVHHQIPVPRPRRIKIKFVPKRTLTVFRTQRLVERICRDENNPRDLPLTSPRDAGTTYVEPFNKGFRNGGFARGRGACYADDLQSGPWWVVF